MNQNGPDTAERRGRSLPTFGGADGPAANTLEPRFTFRGTNKAAFHRMETSKRRAHLKKLLAGTDVPFSYNFEVQVARCTPVPSRSAWVWGQRCWPLYLRPEPRSCRCAKGFFLFRPSLLKARHDSAGGNVAIDGRRDGGHSSPRHRLCVRVCHPCEDFCPPKIARVARLLTVAQTHGSNNGRHQRKGDRNARRLTPALHKT